MAKECAKQRCLALGSQEAEQGKNLKKEHAKDWVKHPRSYLHDLPRHTQKDALLIPWAFLNPVNGIIKVNSHIVPPNKI